MPSCVYDNPATMSREFYGDGKMVCAYTAHLLCSKETRAMGFTDTDRRNRTGGVA